MSQRQKKKRKLHRHLVQPNTVVVPATVEHAIAKPAAPATPTPVKTVQESPVSTMDAAQMRRDLAKVAGVLVVIAIILAAIFYTNRSTNWLGHSGDHLYEWLKLG